MSADAFYAALPMIILALVALGIVGALIGHPWLKERRRAQIRARPFPAPWRRILRHRAPIVAHLPSDLQIRLRRHIQVFLAEKPLIGCNGQAITDEVRVTVAAHACLLLLGHERPDYYPRLRHILIYPDAFVVGGERPVGGGLLQQQRRTLVGESWGVGQVILSWAEVVASAADPTDGRNVVLHEFAHQIDQDKGVADGRPWRPSALKQRRWSAVMGSALQRLRQEPSTVINAYGASEPAEFLAVVTEVFFERPAALAAEVPDVYGELAGLYGVNPLGW
ncbi:MAG: M90 family metallopeptidase [Burkholderiaceae bacterium]